MNPLHAAPIGTTLSHSYFSPGTSIMRGKVCYSPWVIAFYAGQSFRYERTDFGQSWVRVA